MRNLPSDIVLDFELTVYDMADRCGIENHDDLEMFAAFLHEKVENTMFDYAEDAGFAEEYEAQY